MITLATMLVAAGCTEHHAFPTTTVSFEVTITADNGCGAVDTDLCEHTAAPMAFTASVRALRADGTLDTSFTGDQIGGWSKDDTRDDDVKNIGDRTTIAVISGDFYGKKT